MIGNLRIPIAASHGDLFDRQVFIGLDRELERIRDALTTGRSVILSGPFGTGKTAIGMAVAQTMQSTFPGGVTFYAVPERQSAGAIIASAFPVPPTGPSLLIVDEAERLGDRGVTSLLESAKRNPSLTILVTGAGLRPIRNADYLELGTFSQREAREFAQRVASLAGRPLTDRELKEILSTTGTHPRLLAQALYAVVYDGRSTADLPEIYKPFEYVGLVDPEGRPLQPGSSARAQLVEGVRSANARLLDRMRERPAAMYEISSREFEELVAELLARDGFDVELTPPTNDGGFDIYAASKSRITGLFRDARLCRAERRSSLSDDDRRALDDGRTHLLLVGDAPNVKVSNRSSRI